MLFEDPVQQAPVDGGFFQEPDGALPVYFTADIDLAYADRDALASPQALREKSKTLRASILAAARRDRAKRKALRS